MFRKYLANMVATVALDVSRVNWEIPIWRFGKLWDPTGKGHPLFPRKNQEGYAAEDCDPECQEEPEDGFAILAE